ncbi:barstar family protein [Streptomyces sp. NPDC020422]|uniref:barstar family protein n=1 Tax=Streptomyces sp. NPDC020422 TaxID=3365074 RepID=UPI0037B2A00B
MVIIDLASVASEDELHRLLQREFDFPDFYGRNWAAFRDAISGLVLIPEHVRFVGWKPLAERVPELRLLGDLRAWPPSAPCATAAYRCAPARHASP